MQKVKKNSLIILQYIATLVVMVFYPAITYFMGILGDKMMVGITYLIIFISVGFLFGLFYPKFWKLSLLMLWPLLFVVFKAPGLFPVIAIFSAVLSAIILFFSFLGKTTYYRFKKGDMNA